MKRGAAWGVVACYVETQCQYLNWISVQTTGVVLLAPNFMNHLVISFKHNSYQKFTFQDICSVDPSGAHIRSYTVCIYTALTHPSYIAHIISLAKSTKDLTCRYTNVHLNVAKTLPGLAFA